MNFKIILVISIILCLTLFQAVENATLSNEALIECGNIHHIELQNFPQANASFSNGKCRLTCWIGNTILATDSIYEGRSCPEDSTGICRAGHCIGRQDEALLECGLKHSLDFHTMKDHKGTAFTNDQCMLRCVLDGTELSSNHKHESLPCPTNPSGVCRTGACVTQSTDPGSTITKQPTTVPPPTVTQRPLEPFSHLKLISFNLSLVSTSPPLNQHQYLHLWFYQSDFVYNSIARFRGNSSTKLDEWDDNTIAGVIPIKLNRNTHMTIDFMDNGNRKTEQYEDIFGLFEGFYHNHKLPFGEHENFITKFPIYLKHNSNEKLMDVVLRFTVRFNKD